jgi:hypothetical protein
MKIRTLLPVLAGMLAVAAWAAGPAAAQTVPASPKPEAAPAADAVAPYIQSIEQATDPSALISAYANGFAADRTSLKLHLAYIRKMIDFGMPEMAYHQAELAANLDPRNGLVRGVLAYVNAKRGLMPEALSEIVQAATLSPDQPFVQRTAGELLAWYDRNFLNLKIADSTKVSLDSTRNALASRAPFAQAYEEAKKALAEEAAAAAGKTVTPAGMPVAPAAPAPATQPAASNVPTSGAPDAGTVQGGGTYSTVNNNNYSSSSYPQDYGSQDYAGYYPGYYGWTPGWWYPSCGFFGVGVSPFGFTIFDGHHHHDHDGVSGGWAGHHSSLFTAGLSPQAQLHQAVAAASNVGAGTRGVGAGFGGNLVGGTLLGTAAGVHGHSDHGTGGTVFLAVNGNVVSTAHNNGHGVGPFTSGNLEPSSVVTGNSPSQGSGATLHAANSSSLAPGINQPRLMSTGEAFTVNSSSSGGHETHVLSAGSGGSGTSHTTWVAVHATHVMGSSGGGSGGGGSSFSSSSSSGSHFSSSGSHYSGGSGYVARSSGSSGNVSHFSSGSSGGHGGGGHR